jgi:hypothetical protein
LRAGHGSVQDARVITRQRRSSAFVAATVLASWLALVVAGPSVAGAQEASPSASTSAEGPSPSPSLHTPVLDGSVTGAAEKGRTIVIRADATMIGGWQGLHLVEVSLLTAGTTADVLRYDIEDAKVTLDDHDVAVGTGAAASGRYLSVDGSHVVVTTGGAALSIRFEVGVVSPIPADARFKVSVIGDRGEQASVVRSLAAPASGDGITWGTVLTAVFVALVAGGLVGNVFASHRRTPARLSVYGTIQRRIDAERSGSGRP